MNITPLEIRQKVFEKAFRGYDKDEVTGFLNSLSVEWEKLNDQNKELQYKLKASEKEVQKLREVENSLFKTLKTAEDTGANMIEQATKTAELHMKETEMKADALMSEAKSRAKSMIEDAEARARMVVDDMEDEIRQLEQVYRGLDANKNSLMSDLKILANDILDKLSRHQDFPTDIKPHVKKAKELAREVTESNTQDEAVRSILTQPTEPVLPELSEETPLEGSGFSNVRVHTDENASELNSSLDSEETSSPVESAEPQDAHMSVSSTDENESAADTEETKSENTAEDEEKKGSFFDQFD